MQAMLAAAVCTAARSDAADKPQRVTGMGVVIYDFNLRRRWLKKQDAKSDLFQPLAFLKHCHKIGAGGIQANLGVLRADAIGALRDYAELHDLFIDAIIQPPKDDKDVDRFEAEIKTARDVEVQAVRTTIIPGRRYERFKTIEEFREFEQRGAAMLQRAVPVLERHRVPLAVENHKDQRIDERVALFQRLGCQYIGACVDTGNSIALLDDPYEAVEALAPYAFSVHLKDQALKRYDEGFLLGDVPLGQGSLDLNRMVASIRKAKPGIHFALELITRDPLKVPCLTERYWGPMPKVDARDLSNVLRLVAKKPTDAQQVSELSETQQIDLEMDNVVRSLAYAGSELSL